MDSLTPERDVLLILIDGSAVTVGESEAKQLEARGKVLRRIDTTTAHNPRVFR